MRALFVEQWSDLGGGQRLLLDLVAYLRDNHANCAVAFPNVGPVRAKLEAEGVPTFDYDLPALAAGRKGVEERLRFLTGSLEAARTLESVARAFNPDVVICNGGRGALPTVIAARRLGLPVVCIVQLIYGGGERQLLRWCYGRRVVKRVTFCSTMAAAPFRSLGAKALVVPNWVSPQFLDTPRAEARADAQTRVGVLGRISPTKGQRLFLEALLPLLAERPSLTLLLGGDNDFESGDERAHLEALVADSGHASRVTFAGSVDALPFLDTLDVLVVPSLWEEPFGLVAVEGMARRLPVVATRSGALPEIVADRTTGRIVEKDATSLRGAVRDLIDDRPGAARLGAAGRRRVEERFHPARQLRTVFQVIAEAVSGAN